MRGHGGQVHGEGGRDGALAGCEVTVASQVVIHLLVILLFLAGETT